MERRVRPSDYGNLVAAERAKAVRRKTITCQKCAGEFLVPPSVERRGRKYCSWGCRRTAMRGAKGANSGGGRWMHGSANPNWKDGSGYERRQRHKEAEISQWRRRVFARDGYQCQSCGHKPNRPRQLNAHHIRSWAGYPADRFDIGNGITLCVTCHKAVHGAH